MRLLSKVPKGYDFKIISDTVIFVYATGVLSPLGVILYLTTRGSAEYFHVKDATYSAKLDSFYLIESEEKSELLQKILKTL